jgi:hypothetical protein
MMEWLVVLVVVCSSGIPFEMGLRFEKLPPDTILRLAIRAAEANPTQPCRVREIRKPILVARREP